MPQDYFIGLMSGTSMDGIDAALVSFDEHDVAIAATRKQDYPKELRAALFIASREPESCAVDTLGELHTQVGECFRDATLALLAEAGMDASAIRAIGSHGQTVRHRPDADHPFTMQIGDPSIIATGTGIDTVADFRAADVALGGQGAPLTPAFHAWLLRDNSTDRVVLNIGGIANVTVLPSSDQPVSGFDTGPGNTLLDAWIEKHQGAAFDDKGRWAAAGTVDNDLLQELLNDEWIGKTVTLAYREPGQNREPIGIEFAMAGDIGTCGVPHLADMAGEAGGDFGSPHVRRFCDCWRNPFRSNGLVGRDPAVLDQYNHRLAIAIGVVFGSHAFEPGVIGNLANTHLACVQEIAGALDVDRATGRIIGIGRGFRRMRIFGELGKQLAIIANGVCQQSAGLVIRHWRYLWPCGFG